MIRLANLQRIFLEDCLFEFVSIRDNRGFLVYPMCLSPISCSEFTKVLGACSSFILGTVTSRTATSSKVTWRLGVGGSDKQNHNHKLRGKYRQGTGSWKAITRSHHQETEPSRCLKFEPFQMYYSICNSGRTEKISKGTVSCFCNCESHSIFKSKAAIDSK
jgi:hypothetical protein